MIKPPHQRKPRDRKQRDPSNYTSERTQDFIGLVPLRDIPGFESGEVVLCLPSGCNHVRIHDSPWDEMGRPVGPKLEFIHPVDFPNKPTPLKMHQRSLSFTPEFSNPETWFNKSYGHSRGLGLSQGQWAFDQQAKHNQSVVMPSTRRPVRHTQSYSDAVLSGARNDRQTRNRGNQRWTAQTNEQMQYLGPGYQKSPLQRCSSSPERLESKRSATAQNPAIIVSYFQDLHCGH